MLNSVLSISLHGYNLSPFNSYQLIFRAVYEPFFAVLRWFYHNQLSSFWRKVIEICRDEIPRIPRTHFYIFLSVYIVIYICIYNCYSYCTLKGGYSRILEGILKNSKSLLWIRKDIHKIFFHHLVLIISWISKLFADIDSHKVLSSAKIWYYRYSTVIHSISHFMFLRSLPIDLCRKQYFVCSSSK